MKTRAASAARLAWSADPVLCSFTGKTRGLVSAWQKHQGAKELESLIRDATFVHCHRVRAAGRKRGEKFLMLRSAVVRCNPGFVVSPTRSRTDKDPACQFSSEESDEKKRRFATGGLFGSRSEKRQTEWQRCG